MTLDHSGNIIVTPAQAVEGLVFEPPNAGDPRQGRLRLLYTDQKGAWHSLGMPAHQALHLHQLLTEWSIAEGLQSPHEPPH